MSYHDDAPKLIGEILDEYQVVHGDGTINKLGVIALFSGRRPEEVDPLEVNSNEELMKLIGQRDTPMEVVKRIGEIGTLRKQLAEPTPDATSPEQSLETMTNQQLTDLLLHPDTSYEIQAEIARIARERAAQASLSSEDE